MNILITGGCGFIGTHLAKHYLKHGHNVTCIDNYNTSKPNSSLTNIKLDLSKVSVDNTSRLKDVLSNTDLVYHLASPVGVKYIDRSPATCIQDMHNINSILFPLFEQYNSRVVFASTSEVYGNNTNARETDNLIIGSTDVLRWGYACGKLMSEFLLKSYSIPHTTVRFFNVVGPGQLDVHGMVLPTFIKKAMAGIDLTVFGDGKQTRSFCDIRDAIAMLERITESEHVGETYNIGTDAEVTIYELANKVISLTNSKSRIVFKQYEDCFSSQSKDIINRRANIDKIKKIYKPKFDLTDIIKNIIHSKDY